MANPVLEAAVEGIEVEQVGPYISDIIQKGQTGLNLFKQRARKLSISNITEGGGTTRPAFRAQFRPQAGAAIQWGSGDANSMGRGSGSSWDAMVVSPTYLFSVCEISRLAQAATNGKNRASVAVRAAEIDNSLTQHLQGIEGLISSDGSGAFDQIPTGATINNNSGSGLQTSSIVGMNVAFRFTDQQVVSVFPSEGGTSRGTATISIVDAVTNTLYFSTALPAGTTNGDYLMIANGSGALASSILGIPYWHTNSNTGTVGGVNRSKWPSRLSTPTINLNGGAITPGIAQRAQVLLGRAIGPDNESNKSSVWYGPSEQQYALSMLFYNVQIAQNLQRSTSVPDMARRDPVNTFGSREYIPSYSANPNRIDLLLMSSWCIGELVPTQLYQFGTAGTIVPVPDSSGTYLMSHMFAYETAFQLVNAAPRKGLYIQQIGVPSV